MSDHGANVLDLAVILPTYNERENVPLVLARLAKVLQGLSWEAVFVDDDSPDGTAAVIAEQARLCPNVRLVHRVGRRGLASACIEGMLATHAHCVAVMDADMQHDERILPAMYERLHRESLDVVVGTRNSDGGSMGGFSKGRVLLSRMGKKVSSSVCQSDVSDPMSGFFMLRRSFLLEVVHDLQGTGFKILVDVLASSRRPVRLAEVGYTFRARTHGESKLDIMVGVEYVSMIVNKLLGGLLPVELVHYLMVGGVGVLMHLTVFVVLMRTTHLRFAEMQAISALVAMIENFFLNNILTFRDRRLSGSRLVLGALSFVLVCLFGAWADVVLSTDLSRAGMSWYAASFAGILIGSVWNLSISSQFTWRVRRQRVESGSVTEYEGALEGTRLTSADSEDSAASEVALRWPLYVLWAAVCCAVPLWAWLGGFGWDLAVYGRAMQALREGADPYLRAMAVQTAIHLQGGVAAGADPPYSYVYSPMTLPVLRLLAMFPAGVAATLYWLVYAVAVIAQTWAGLQAAVTAQERRVFLYVVPVVAFFPGLLANGTVLGGNVAYPIYAVVLCAAAVAWLSGSWAWFYTAVLAASCVKAPLLSLAVIPLLTARRQWLPAAGAIVAGAALFGVQRLVWPELFTHYLQAVALQFAYNRDFGCSPAGLVSDAMYAYRLQYTVPAAVVYLCTAGAVLATLAYLARMYLRGLFSLKAWVPVVLVGVILLNPRLMEYDVSPVTLPMALIVYRRVRRSGNRWRAAWSAGILFVVLNGLGLTSWTLRKDLDGALLVLCFVIGSLELLRAARGVQDGSNQMDLTDVISAG